MPQLNIPVIKPAECKKALYWIRLNPPPWCAPRIAVSQVLPPKRHPSPEEYRPMQIWLPDVAAY